MGISGLPAASQAAITQSQVQSEVSMRVLKMAQEQSKQVGELVEQTAQAIQQSTSAGGLDVYA